ncbi:MAG: 3,4-dihydroxy-2-butanone-4-phosphate synthase, partial [Spirochaetes bacterium]|nr:3,4-dihydroxy-2-butanone-4-phosphate synthase [Spirochaetota bacterium]
MPEISHLIQLFSQGFGVVVFDGKSRENEADLIFSIEKITPEKITFMINEAKGLLCAALSEKLLKEKGFPLMPSLRNDVHATAFTLSVDSSSCKTGISPDERYLTCLDL